MHEERIQEAVSRIRRMERLFDEVLETVRSNPEQVRAPSVQASVQTLSDYYSGGDWLDDYELDEQRLLPPGLKRGVLSQDGLYDVLQIVLDEHET